MNQKTGARRGDEVRRRGEERWLVEWEARTAKIPLQSPKVRAKRKRGSSQPQILLCRLSLAVTGDPQPDLKGSESPRPSWTVP